MTAALSEGGYNFVSGWTRPANGSGKRHEFRRGSVRHRRGIGGRARRQNRGWPWRESNDRRGIPDRGNLRHPRLRAEETARLRQPFRGCFSRRRGFWMERGRDAFRMAEARRRQGEGDPPPLSRLSRESGKLGRRNDRTAG